MSDRASARACPGSSPSTRPGEEQAGLGAQRQQELLEVDRGPRGVAPPAHALGASRKAGRLRRGGRRLERAAPQGPSSASGSRVWPSAVKWRRSLTVKDLGSSVMTSAPAQARDGNTLRGADRGRRAKVASPLEAPAARPQPDAASIGEQPDRSLLVGPEARGRRAGEPLQDLRVRVPEAVPRSRRDDRDPRTRFREQRGARAGPAAVVRHLEDEAGRRRRARSRPRPRRHRSAGRRPPRVARGSRRNRRCGSAKAEVPSVRARAPRSRRRPTPYRRPRRNRATRVAPLLARRAEARRSRGRAAGRRPPRPRQGRRREGRTARRPRDRGARG